MVAFVTRGAFFHEMSQASVKPHVISRCIMIAAVFDLTPQDLGVLESSRPHCSHGTAPAVAVPGNGAMGGKISKVSWKQWKRLTRCHGCWKPGWPIYGGIWKVWSQGEKDTRCLLQKYAEKISCWSWKTIDPGNIETGSSQWRWLSLSYVSFFLHDVSLPLVHWLNMKKHVHPTNSRKESSMFDSDHKSCWSTNSPDLKAAE